MIFEDNLMWGPRLAKSIQHLGHDAQTLARIPDPIPAADVAIINLGSQALPPSSLVPQLKQREIKIVAHAGHKEKELLALGKDLGCDYLASNSEITNKIGDILKKL